MLNQVRASLPGKMVFTLNHVYDALTVSRKFSHEFSSISGQSTEFKCI